MNYEKNIYDALGKDILTIEEVSHSNNIVFKVVMKSKEVYYAKIYLSNSSHIDHELDLYELINNKYLKELVYSTSNPKMAIYKELKGRTVDSISDNEMIKYSDKIVDSLCDFFDSISNIHVNGYGILDKKMNGTSSSFEEFIVKRQSETSNKLKDYPYLANLFKAIYSKYREIIIGDNTLIPIDTNMKNIMVLEDGSIKFIDPGELISGSKLMGYGDFVAHSYKTILYDKLITRLNLSCNDKKLLRIYAIFSSLNILAFLHDLGVEDLASVIPFGNKYTFYNLISEHIEVLDIDRK